MLLKLDGLPLVNLYDQKIRLLSRFYQKIV